MRALVRQAGAPALVLLLALSAIAGDAFRVETLADGVLLFRPDDGDATRVNSLVVERDDGLLVVGAQPTPAAARELLASIAERIGKPVRYVVLPHSHAEASAGVSAFPQTALPIASREFAQALGDAEYDYGAEMRVRATGSAAWVEPERPRATLILDASVTLADPRNEIALVPQGGRHSAGDLVVSLPQAGITFFGAMAFPDGRPYGEEASIKRWISSLSQLLRHPPRLLIPLRGPAIDAETIRAQRAALGWLRARTADCFAERLDDEESVRRLLAEEDLARHFDPKSEFLPGLIGQTLAEITADARKVSGE